MNLEKFTERARGFLQSAQTVAVRLNHQRIAPAHLLKALLEDEQGMASGLIARACALRDNLLAQQTRVFHQQHGRPTPNSNSGS